MSERLKLLREGLLINVLIALMIGPGPPASAGSEDLTPLIRMPAGDFIHPGSNDGLRLHVDAFQLEEVPVTWKKYKSFAQGTPNWTPILARHEVEFPQDAPVVYVTWDQAQAYCGKIGRRLPTELEWEYAAAGGRKRQPYTYTPEEEAELSWYGGAKKAPKPVRQGKANPYGIFDLHGNVWEWVEDMRGNYARKDARDPNSGTDNLGCGNVSNENGSYAWFLRAAVRSAARPDQPMRFRGFRCAL